MNTGLLALVTSWYTMLRNSYLNRNSIKVTIGMDGVEKPTVAVTIINQSNSQPANIHKVTVRYGNFHFSRAFVLFPQSKVTLPTKDKGKWVLSFDQVVITKRTRSKNPDFDHDPNSHPGIDSPAQLFNAIGMGNETDSWLEIDFNEYEDRVYLKGKVKEVFDMVGKTHRSMRNKS
jgi:hypothetical protein